MKTIFKKFGSIFKGVGYAVKDNPKTTAAGVGSILLGASVIVNEPSKANLGLGEILAGVGLILSADSRKD